VGGFQGGFSAPKLLASSGLLAWPGLKASFTFSIQDLVDVTFLFDSDDNKIRKFQTST
jgi:hypothetical protein